jgi:hypothetical protein
VVRFSESKRGVVSAGAEISNGRLAIPSVVPGSPIQVDGQALQHTGWALVILTDADPRLAHGALAIPPLPAPRRGSLDDG